MGIGGGETRLIFEQMKFYYIFQKKLSSVLNNTQNFTFANESNSKLEIQEVYLINYNWIRKWKKRTNYEIAKDSFDKIVANNEKDLERQMEIIFHNLMESHLIPFEIFLPFLNNEKAFNQITSKRLLELQEFECMVDKKTFKLFKETGEVFFWLSEAEFKIDLILSEKLIVLLIKEKYLAKFLYYGFVENDNQLIQITAKLFDKEGEGYNSKKIYETFIKFLLNNDENFLIESFKNNIGFVKNNYFKLEEGFLIQFQNENLALKYQEETKNIKLLNFKNVDKFREVGLANIGATCYMNATLECFINVDPLTRYLLTESNYNRIINNTRTFELSSAYCELLASVCCDENITNYYEPYNFKDIISWKNPLFEGVNANDSKDLINFMLEEMNQELRKLNGKDENTDNLNQINQQDPLLTLKNFQNEFIKKNDSIISRTFFFIIESKSQCQGCRTVIYNYQCLFLLEFPLEAVYNFFTSHNYNLINNQGKKVINLVHCLEHYREPTIFSGENQFYCNICRKQTDNINSNILYSLPPYLIIILNRGKGKSFDCIVDFPDILNLQNYVMCPQSICNYQLSGVICHLGKSGMSGHFIAYCRQRINNKWYCFNDSTITLCKDQENDYKKGTPYILFYKSIDQRPNILFNNVIPIINNNLMTNSNQNNFNNNSFNNRNFNINSNMNNFNIANNRNNCNNINSSQNNFNSMNMMNNEIMINNNMANQNNNMNNNMNINMNNNLNCMNNNMNGMNNNINCMNNNMNGINNNMNGMNNNMNGMSYNMNGMNNNMNSVNNCMNSMNNNMNLMNNNNKMFNSKIINMNNNINNSMKNISNQMNVINNNINSNNMTPNFINGNQNNQMNNSAMNNNMNMNFGFQNMNFSNNFNNNNMIFNNNINKNFN